LHHKLNMTDGPGLWRNAHACMFPLPSTFTLRLLSKTNGLSFQVFVLRSAWSHMHNITEQATDHKGAFLMWGCRTGSQPD